MIRNRNNHRALASILTVALLCAGCAGINLQSHIAQTAGQALDLAQEESDREKAQRYLLRSASQFQERGDHAAARTLLQSAQLTQLSPPLQNQKLLLAMATAKALDDRDWAQQLTEEISPDHFTGYSTDLLTRAANLQADTYVLANDQLSAAATLILLTQTDAEASPQPLHDRIWELLKAVPDQKLITAAGSAIGFETQGWLELAAAVRAPDGGLDEQGRIIRRWQNNWPSHPGAQILPTELQLIASLAASRPEKIVLALPLKGPLASAGKAIRDGFIAAYYQDESADRSKTDIRILDTSSGKPFAEMYRELSEQDTDLIVGPLEKEALTSLSTMHTLPVPTLGLNYLPEGSSVPEGLYQFGLSAEDEARQIADRLAEDMIEQVLVLVPQGQWGDRVEAALLQRMVADGLTALDIERFYPEDNLRTVTADLLGITTSRNRAIQVERTIGLNVEFEPRRRQDAQAIVMVAEPTVARQLNPLFAFYFGGDLPVYAPSIIYEGTANPGRDRDLDQVLFTDVPWVLDDTNDLRAKAGKYLSGTRGQLGRLFAMGADAWQLSKRLPLLRQVESASLQGQTGTLTMNPAGDIHRLQLWARFQNGTPVAVSDVPAPGTGESPDDNVR